MLRKIIIFAIGIVIILISALFSTSSLEKTQSSWSDSESLSATLMPFRYLLATDVAVNSYWADVFDDGRETSATYLDDGSILLEFGLDPRNLVYSHTGKQDRHSGLPVEEGQVWRYTIEYTVFSAGNRFALNFSGFTEDTDGLTQITDTTSFERAEGRYTSYVDYEVEQGTHEIFPHIYTHVSDPNGRIYDDSFILHNASLDCLNC